MSDNMTVRSQAKLKPVFIGRQWFIIPISCGKCDFSHIIDT